MTTAKDNEHLPLERAVAILEQQLTLTEGFMFSLLETPSDWAFVVQTSAMMEAALSHLIVHTLGRSELEDLIAHVDMAHRKTGKIQMARRLGVLDDVETRFLNSLAELRNDLVHNVRQVSFSLSNYTAGMNKDQLKSFTLKFNAFESESTDITYPDGTTVAMTEHFKSNPRLAIWNSAMTVAGLVHARVDFALAKRAANNAALAAAQSLMEAASSLRAIGHLTLSGHAKLS